MNDAETHLEGRDWVGNPDGTLVYWQKEADEARAKVDAIRGLHVQEPKHDWCLECEYPWPCATVHIINGDCPGFQDAS